MRKDDQRDRRNREEEDIQPLVSHACPDDHRNLTSTRLDSTAADDDSSSSCSCSSNLQSLTTGTSPTTDFRVLTVRLLESPLTLPFMVIFVLCIVMVGQFLCSICFPPDVGCLCCTKSKILWPISTTLGSWQRWSIDGVVVVVVVVCCVPWLATTYR